MQVEIVLKKGQRIGKRTTGVVKHILTSSAFHPHGIKVRLEDGQIGRVRERYLRTSESKGLRPTQGIGISKSRQIFRTRSSSISRWRGTVDTFFMSGFTNTVCLPPSRNSLQP
jgi:uncharacterized repeat protein (TIGR03833 family)